MEGKNEPKIQTSNPETESKMEVKEETKAYTP